MKTVISGPYDFYLRERFFLPLDVNMPVDAFQHGRVHECGQFFGPQLV
jgi:hypothetical protein